MTPQNRLLVGTALCLLMTGASAARAETGTPNSVRPTTPLILAQAEEPSGAECPPGTSPAPEGDGCVAAEPQEAPAEEEAPAAEEPAPEPEPEVAPAEEPPTEQAPEEAAPETEEPALEAEPMAEPEEPAPVEEAPPEGEAPAEPTGDAQDEQSAEPDAEAPAAEETAEPQADEEQPAPEGQPGEETPADSDAPADAEPQGEELPADEEAPAETMEEGEPDPAEMESETSDEAPATDDCPPGMRMSGTAGACVPAVEEDVAPAEELTPQEETQSDEEAPADETGEPTDEAAPPEETEAEGGEGAAQEGTPEDAAPVLDSQKEEGAAVPEDGTAQDQPAEGEESTGQPAEETAIPESDEQAQEDAIDPEQVREEIRTMIQEEGERIQVGDTREDRQTFRREFYQRREGAHIIEEYNDNRTIIEVNNNVYIESPDYDRIILQDDEVYYERLQRGRIREVVVRSDGARVITIRNEYGDVVRRVRVMPDGREYVLVYVPEDRYDRLARFEDPALDLPPLRLTIPVSEYILEAETVDDPDRYYAFLDQPPVEPVRRLYSLEEVRYSARVRDMVRRVDLDTIEFEFGSARIEESEIADLEALSEGMSRLLEENPAETFLIEGHTDAVGSDMANLALSDRRAEAVARALTNVFGLPPENLVTQGYGEQYLKVNTQERERENRRVAVRRITPLVSPVASRQQ